VGSRAYRIIRALVADDSERARTARHTRRRRGRVPGFRTARVNYDTKELAVERMPAVFSRAGLWATAVIHKLNELSARVGEPMLTPIELEALATDLESDRVERKAALSDPGKVRQAICAFANDLPDHQQPGVVFVGVKDDGTCANLQITGRPIEDTREYAGRRQDPAIPIMAVQKMTLGGCDVAVIEVQPAFNPPVRLDGRAWIRVGPRRATASADEERV